MAQDDSKSISNLLNAIKKVDAAKGGATPAPGGYLTSGRNLSTTPTYLNPNPTSTRPFVTPSEPPSNDLLSKVASGDSMNVWGYLFRAITGLGRGIANMSDTVNEQFLRDKKLKAQGKYNPFDLGKSVNDQLQIGWSGIRGLGDSIFPGFAEATGGPIKESFYDVNRSAAAKELLKDDPAYKALTSEDKLVSWDFQDAFGIKDFNVTGEITPAGLTSFAMDAALDPASYMTFGLGGATKGAFRGVSDVARYQKAGKPANLADVPKVTLPRPFYGSKTTRQMELETIPYNVTNIGPWRYVGKETTRGFTEAHRYWAARAESKAAARRAPLGLAGTLAENLINRPDLTPEGLGEVASASVDAILERENARLAAAGIATESEREQILIPVKQALADQVQEMLSQPQVLKQLVASPESITNITKAAADKGITPLAEATWRIADRFAMGIRETQPAISRTKQPKYMSGDIQELGRNIEASSLVKGSGEWASAWDDFSAKTSPETRAAVIEALTSPIGYREKAARARTGKAMDAKTRHSDLVDGIYGLNLSPLARTARTASGDLEDVLEAIPGTGKARVKTVLKSSAEYKQILGILKDLSIKTYGAGSQTTKAKRILVTESELYDAPTQLVDNLARNYYNSLGRDIKWEDLQPRERADIAKDLLDNPEKITGELLQQSMPSPLAMAARIQYLGQRDAITETGAFTAIQHWRKQQYNPVTAEGESLRSVNLAFGAEEMKAARETAVGRTTDEMTQPVDKAPVYLKQVQHLMMEAVGRVSTPELRKTLTKLNLRLADFYKAGDMLPIPRIQEKLEKALIRVLSDERMNYVRKMELIEADSITAAAAKTAIENDKAVLKEFQTYIADLESNGEIVTEAEIADAIAELGGVVDRQAEAIAELSKLGLDINGSAAPLRVAMTTFDRSVTKGRGSATTIAEKYIAAVANAVKAPAEDMRPTGPISVEEAFGATINKLEDIANLPQVSNAAKTLIDTILNDPTYGLKNIDEGTITPKEIAAYSSRIGKLVKDANVKLERGSVAGFDVVFKREDGRYDETGITNFLYRAYQGSKGQNSEDGGFFANYIDTITTERRMPALSTLTGQQGLDAASNIAKEWRGEGITVPLLFDTLRTVEAKGTKVAATKKQDLSKIDNGRFMGDIRRNTAALRDRMIKAVVEEEDLLSKTIKQNELVATERLGSGKMLKAQAQNVEEEAIITANVNRTYLPLTQSGETLDLLKAYLAETKKAGINKLSGLEISRTIDGKNVRIKSLSEIQDGDLLDYNYFRVLVQSNEGNFPGRNIALKIYLRGYSLAHRNAADEIAYLRASKMVDATYPAYATEKGIADAAAKTSDPYKAKVDARARLMLAEILAKADREIIRYDNKSTVVQRLKSKLDRTKGGLNKEKKEFDKIVNDLVNSYKKAGYTWDKIDVTTTPFIVDGAISDLYTSNPINFLRKVTTLKVVTEQDRSDWSVAMQYLLDLQLVGNRSEYENFSELIESYVNASTTTKPGDINTITGRRVPTNQEMAELLNLFGANLEAANPQRRTIISALNKVSERITAEEFARIKNEDFISAAQVAGADEIRDLQQIMPDPKIVMQRAHAELGDLLASLHAENLDIISVLAASMVGKSANQFFRERASELVETVKDSLGREVSVSAPNEAGKIVKRKGMLQTWEAETNYTGWKVLLQQLSDIAKQEGYDIGDPRRAALMTELAMRTLEVRDAYLMARGIVPSVSMKLKVGEGRIQRIFKLDEDDLSKIKTTYLSEFDVMGLFDRGTLGELFFVGRETSMPITAMMPAARLLVSAYDNLPIGKYFDQDQLQGLSDTMVDLMMNQIRKQTSVISGKNKISALAVNNEAITEKVRIIVATMLDSQNAQALHRIHVENATVALKLLKYRADKLSKPVMEAWERMLSNPYTGVGSKLDQTIEATAQLRAIVEAPDEEDSVRLMAVMDANTVMAANMDYDSLITLQEAVKIADAPTGEAAAIRATQKGASKATQQNVAQALVETAQNRDALSASGLAMKLKVLDDNNAISTSNVYDVFIDHKGAEAQMNLIMKFSDKVLTKFSYNYGMEALRPYYGAVERQRVEAATEFEVVATNLAKAWAQKTPGRNIMKEAFDGLREVDGEILEKAFQARQQLDELLQDAQAAKSLNLEMYEQLKQESRLIETVFPEADPMLAQAARELWVLFGSLVGGKDKSRLVRAGITPKWLNRTIRDLGTGRHREMIDKDGNLIRVKDGFGFNPNAKSMADAADDWREWDIENPLEAIVSLNTAMIKAAQIPHFAAQITKDHGILKSSLTPADAKAQGLVEVKSVPFLSDGKELVYFLQTEKYYYPLPIAQELEKFSKFVAEIKHLQRDGKLESFLIKTQPVQNFAKVWYTLMTPKNWFQNFSGGMWANFYAGVNSPMVYFRAGKLLTYKGLNLKQLGVDTDKFDSEISKYFAGREKEGFKINPVNDPRSSESVQITVNGKKTSVNYADLEKLFNKFGGYVPVAQSREYDLLGEFGDPANLTKRGWLKNVTDRYQRGIYNVGKVAGGRDNFLRAALFIDEMTKLNWTSLEAGAREAMKRVDRYHPQMQDLSGFNQKYTRNFILFFTWRAKMLATIIGDSLDKPGRILLPLRAQYSYNEQNEIETQSGRFGDFTPEGPLPDWMKYNMDPLTSTASGSIFKFSTANPVTDLMGSAGWLSGIDFNNYEPLQNQIGNNTLETFDRIAIQSTPVTIDWIIDWFYKKETQDKTAITDYFAQMPALVDDTLKRLGWGAPHIFLAAAMPGVFGWSKPGWKQMLTDEVGKKAADATADWFSGLKITEITSLDNRKRGVQDILSTIRQLQGMN